MVFSFYSNFNITFCKVTVKFLIRQHILRRLGLHYLPLSHKPNARPDDFGQVHQGLHVIVGFLLIQYSVVCTVESLSLFHLLFMSLFRCSRRRYSDKLGISRVDQASICPDPQQT